MYLDGGGPLRRDRDWRIVDESPAPRSCLPVVGPGRSSAVRTSQLDQEKHEAWIADRCSEWVDSALQGWGWPDVPRLARMPVSVWRAPPAVSSRFAQGGTV